MKTVCHANRRILSIVISFLLTLSMFSLNGLSIEAHAASMGTSSVYSYEELKTALAASDIDEVVIPLGVSITVSGMFYGNGDVIIPQDKSLLVQGDLTTTSIHDGSYFKWSIANYGKIVVQNGGTLTLSSGGHGGVASISNSGLIDIQSGSELNVTVADYENYGIMVYHTGGDVRLAGNVSIKNTGTQSRGIWMWDDNGELEIAGGNINIQTGSEASEGILADCNVKMTGGNVSIDVGGPLYGGNFEFRDTFYMSGGTITSNKTNGFYSSGGELIMAGGRIVANPSVSNAFYHGWYSSMTFLDTKDCISGSMGYDQTLGSAAFQLYYGTLLNLYDDETGYPIEFPSGYFYKTYDYNGMKLVPLSSTNAEMSFSMQGYESGPYAFEPVTDAQQVRSIYLNPYRPRTVSESSLTIPKGTEKTIDINLGKYSNVSDSAIIECDNESVASISHARLDQHGQITVTAVNSGYANIKVTFKGGKYDTTENVSVYVPYECNVKSVNKPTGAVIEGSNIKASVPNYIAAQEIDVTVSEEATWGLYSDATCRNKIENKQMTLSTGDNTAYIKVQSKSYETKVYALTVTRARPIIDNNDGGGGSGGSGGSGGGSGSRITAPNLTDLAPVTGPVSVSNATGLTQRALEVARQSGATSAIIRFKNVGELSLEAAQAMLKTAGKTPLKVHADSTLNNGTVDVRISFNPAQLTKNIHLSASTISSRAKSTKSLFAKWYSNKTQIISFVQQGDFGMPVEAAIKLDKELDAKTLLFYGYDQTANTYKQITNPNYWIDANGYVHFTTALAGDIVITDKPLQKKIAD